MEEENYERMFKVVLVGDSSVGKTNIMSKYLKNEFHEDSKATVGVEFGSKQFNIEGHPIKAQIWDTAGQERYKAITSAYYKGAKGAFVVYDITRKQSFDSVDRWINDLKAAADKTIEEGLAAAPETFDTDQKLAGDGTAIAWIMWDSQDWNIVYSVGDTYDPDSKTAGIVATDVEVTGEGTYTIGLDFTGTDAGVSISTAFSAIGIANAEELFPGYVINIKEVLINGEPYKLHGRNYTSSDDGLCTRSNLYNEWVPAVPDDARTSGGGTTGCSPTVFDQKDLGEIKTLEITAVDLQLFEGIAVVVLYDFFIKRFELCAIKPRISCTPEIEKLCYRYLEPVECLAHIDFCRKRKIFRFKQIDQRVPVIVGIFQPPQDLIAAGTVIETVQQKCHPYARITRAPGNIHIHTGPSGFGIFLQLRDQLQKQRLIFLKNRFEIGCSDRLDQFCRNAFL